MPEITLQQAFDLAIQHHQAGRLQEAETIYLQILAVDAKHADSLHFLGLIAHQIGKNEIAVDLIRQAIVLQPDDSLAFSNLGNALREMGQLDESIAACRRAISLQPDLPAAHYNLGNSLQDKRQPDEAITAYRHAITLQPDFAEAHSNLGNVLTDKGQLDEAMTAYRQAIALRPDFAPAYNNLGNALSDKGQLDDAIAVYRQAVALQPGDSRAYYNLGITHGAMEQLDEAIAACRQAIALQPDFAEAHSTLGNALKDKGQLDEAIVAYRHAITLKPDLMIAHSNLVLCMNYHPGINASTIVEEHRCWNQTHAKPLRQFLKPHTNNRDPQRSLRIGYVSPDFRNHSVAYFIENLLEHHDRSRVEVFCYSNVSNPDAVTARMQKSAGHWRSITGQADAEVAELIRSDGIDILVDLAGHTADHRLPVFARKPAPVQVNWLGYPNTTGLETIDYRLTDAFADPPGSTEHLHSEQLVRLPRSMWCYRPSGQSPPVSATPVNETGHITFGCFNAMPKINDALLELWAKILLAVPDSRLLLKNKSLAEASLRLRIGAALEEAGIDPDRIEILGPVTGIADHLANYGRVDIALDTFPYHGTTTTCEALWMGVPVVTLAGQSHVSRVGVSLLTNLGCPEWITASPEEYLDLAVALAKDLPRLAQLRSTLREHMEKSPLMDAAAFALDIEAAYRTMWYTWCAQPESQPCPK